MKVAYKYRLYPNKEQEQKINEFCHTYNLLYNIGVDIVKTYIVREQRLSGKTKTVKSKKDVSELTFPVYKYPSKLAIQNMIYHLKDEIDTEWWGYIQNPKTLERKDELKKLFSEIPANCFHYISTAIKNSIDTKFNQNKAKSKKKPKSLIVDGIEEIDYTGLKFHKFNVLDCSYSFQAQRLSALKLSETKKAYFNLIKIGLTKMVYHRPIPEGSKFDQVTISRKNNEYYISLCGLELPTKEMINSKDVSKTVGIDINTDNYIVSSDNDTYINPAKKLLKMKKRIRRLQKRNGENKKDAICKSKRDYKSKGFRKNLLTINKIYNKITNIKKHIIHNATKKFTSEYDAVFAEDLNVKAMQHFNGSMVQKNNFFEFSRQLKYKSEREGTLFMTVGRFFQSSQICSKCGKIHPEMKNLNKRVFRCECGNIISRDLNAALNINNEGKKLLTNES